MMFFMGSTTIKRIKGNEYLYFVYYENRKKKEVYCGLVSDPKSEKILLQFKVKRLKEQKKNLSQNIIEMETKIKTF